MDCLGLSEDLFPAWLDVMLGFFVLFVVLH